MERGATELELENTAKNMFFRGVVPTGATLRKVTGQEGTSTKLTAEEFAEQGGDLLAEGAVFDFSEFNKVVGGKPGPMFDAAMKRAKKYGTGDTYILTARNQAAAPAIKEFLDAMGLDIPIENITGLGNSTGEAKARWLLDKHSQQYHR